MRSFADDLAEARGRRGGRPRVKRDYAAAWLSAYLASGRSVSARFVFGDARAAGISAKTLRRAADELGVVRNDGRGARWRRADV